MSSSQFRATVQGPGGWPKLVLIEIRHPKGEKKKTRQNLGSSLLGAFFFVSPKSCILDSALKMAPSVAGAFWDVSPGNVEIQVALSWFGLLGLEIPWFGLA